MQSGSKQMKEIIAKLSTSSWGTVLRFLVCACALVHGTSLASSSAGEPDRKVVEQLVLDQLKSWETEDEELFRSTAHPDLVFAYPGKRMGLEGALDVFKFWKENFSDTRIHIHAIVIEGKRFSVEYQYATTKDETGIRTASGTVTTGYVEDGRLRVWKEYLDGRVSRLQAKGELPVDEFAEPYPWPDVKE